MTPAVLFTAFEPSGDAHAAGVIEELRHRAPGLRIYAWGGPKMEQAGATIVQNTSADGSMGLGALKKIREMRREVRHIARWSKSYRVLAHVPVDSPAANFPICKVMKKKRGAKIVHLVAPQVWAWAPWRIGKLRKLTDLVLCLLPFEEPYFKDRGVPASFIGHPRINRKIDEEQVRDQMRGLPQGNPRIAILPGSRSQEVRANLKLLSDVFTELQGRHHSLSGVIVAANSDIASLVRQKLKLFPTGLSLITGPADPVILWADLCLAVSGTITLDITRQTKAMIGVYKTSPTSVLLSKLLLRTRYRLLPNIIAEREIVPEFVPYAGGPMPIVKAASELLQDSKKAAVQQEHLARVLTRFAHKKPSIEAAKRILEVIGYTDTTDAQPVVEVGQADA